MKASTPATAAHGTGSHDLTRPALAERGRWAGLKLRNQRPDGKLVFGGRKNLERRRKGLITAGDMRALRLRPLVSMGDKERLGNLHFRFLADGRTCTVRVYGTAVTRHLPEMRGKCGDLIRAVAALAAAGEINVEFR